MDAIVDVSTAWQRVATKTSQTVDAVVDVSTAWQRVATKISQMVDAIVDAFHRLAAGGCENFYEGVGQLLLELRCDLREPGLAPIG